MDVIVDGVADEYMVVEIEFDSVGVIVSMAVFDDCSLALKDGEPLIEMELEPVELSDILYDIEGEPVADNDVVMLGVSV